MPELDEFGREKPPPPRSSRDAGGGGSTRRHHPAESSPRHHHHHRSSHHHDGPRRGSSKKSSSLQHPSLLYVSEPLFCEYVWKDQKEGRAAAAAGDSKNENDADNKNSDNTFDDTTDNNKTNETETYESYRRAYCLNYIRAFFNQHMDDSWFRQRYSAALRRRLFQQEQKRAVAEAQSFAATVRSTEQVSLTSADQWNAHLFRCCQGPQQASPQQTVLIISKIPSNLTDEQLLSAIQDGKKLLQEDLTLWPVHSKEPYLFRSVCILGPTAVLKDLSSKQTLSIECSSDPYNRMEYDADGHGGATADGLEVPLRKATVHMHSMVSPQPKIVSLTKALSSKTRHATDCVSALQLAAQLDAQQKIPSDVRLASILERMSSATAEQLSDVDRLDTAIAYLRRIHLRHFYHNVDHTANEQSFGDMIVHHNILYVRIKNAPDDEAPDDLLVQSLDQSIERALAASATESSQQEGLQTEADTIAQAMQQTERKWLDDHNISDNRGRARCSFHFCKKLFQDSTFLHKHLFKKHGEFLSAEQAKCHDVSMMAAWDNIGDQPRPVPDVLVECGVKFGLVPVPLQPGAVPDIVDPEPGLFEEEEARQAMFAKRREEVRGERKPRPVAGGAGFIDVDDMKEEKIELSMDDVAAVVPVKKKKKKRKLL